MVNNWNVHNKLPINNSLISKTVFITGATSGIGKALVLLLSKNNSNVIAHGRSKQRLDSLVSSSRKQNISTVVGDLSKKIGWHTVENVISKRKPEILILNAGFNCRKEYASHYTDSEIFEMIQVNFISNILFARTFARLPKLTEPRRLALILSTSCHFAREKMSLYIACKSGLMGFGKTLQQEADILGVQTTLFYPGRTNSGFRKIPNSSYMNPENVAQTIFSILCLPNDIVPYEFIFRPKVDKYE